jgi:hypothetical protein
VLLVAGCWLLINSPFEGGEGDVPQQDSPFEGAVTINNSPFEWAVSFNNSPFEELVPRSFNEAGG